MRAWQTQLEASACERPHASGSLWLWPFRFGPLPPETNYHRSIRDRRVFRSIFGSIFQATPLNLSATRAPPVRGAVRCKIMWRKITEILSTVFPALILIGFFAVIICYVNQWDSVVWVTVIPIWFWAGIGIVTSLLSWIFFRSSTAIFTLCLWLVTGIGFSEETRFLLRDSWSPSSHQKPGEADSESRLRIVTLDCHNGNLDAAQGVIELKPDIVFLQESVSRPELSQLKTAIFGESKTASFAMSSSRNGNAIIARGKFLFEKTDGNSPTLHVRLQLQPEKLLIDLTNVNLLDCLPDWSVWKRDSRKNLTRTRIVNRRALRSYVADFDLAKKQPPRIVGGNFSTPSGDDIFRFLADAGLRDSYALCGRGWGNTYTNSVPFLRTDQIWMSPEITPLVSRVVISPHSNHRIVVCDFEISKPR